MKKNVCFFRAHVNHRNELLQVKTIIEENK